MNDAIARGGSRWDGAAIGTALGLVGLVTGLAGLGVWLAAAIPAGAVAGAAAAPSIRPGQRIGARPIIGSALIASIVGSGTIAAWFAVEAARSAFPPPDGILSQWLGFWLAGLVLYGWLATIVLSPVAWIGAAIVRRRLEITPDLSGRSVRSGVAWLSGIVIGVAGGALSLVIPVIGWTIGIAFAVGALVSRTTIPSIGGFLLGSGSIWTALLVLADSRCREGCTSSDTTPWIVLGVAMLVGGAALTVIAARGRLRRGR